jgi:rhamnogalacturonan endolyase
MFAVLALASFSALAAAPNGGPPVKPKVTGWATERVEEKLDRGMIAVAQGDGKVYLGWRLLKTDPAAIAFNVYRGTAGGDAERLNAEPLRRTTDFVDAAPPLDRENAWWVRPVVEGREGEGGGRAALPPNPPARPYVLIKLQGNYSVHKVGIGDLDGDGRYDFVVKQPLGAVDPGVWRPSPDTYKLEAYKSDGTFLWRHDLGWSIELGVWYSPYVVFDLDGDGKAEVAVKTGEGDPRDAAGHVQTGPEWCSILDGRTGQEITRAPWPSREGRWGDNYGNRISRHMMGVAYLDGKTPCLLLVRGIYTIMKVDAYQYRDRKLRKVWSWTGEDENPPYRGQGAHTIHAADVDGDGRDEVLLGSCVVDDNGQGLWSTGFGHPDRFFVTDVDPSRGGLEVFYGLEVPRRENGVCLVEARTGKVIWGTRHPTEHIARALTADIDPSSPGMECWAATQGGSRAPKDPAITSGPTRWLFSAQGKVLAEGRDIPPLGGLVWWDADRMRELENGGAISKWHGPVLTRGIEGKALAWADLLGDWREEIVAHVPGELRIYTTVIPAADRRLCLMQDPIYRLDVAFVAMGYEQPPMTSFYLGGDSAGPPAKPDPAP